MVYQTVQLHSWFVSGYLIKSALVKFDFSNSKFILYVDKHGSLYFDGHFLGIYIDSSLILK